MKSFATLLLVMLCAAAGPISASSSVDDVLDALDARGKDLKSLTADVKLTDSDPTTGDTGDIRTGRLFFKLLPDGDSQWRATFDKKQTGQKVVDQKHEWAYVAGNLTERDYRNQTQQTTQILKPGEKMQLFNLDGPLPLPLGQDKADVHQHFDVQKIAPDKDDPAGTVHLQLIPIAGTDLARKFKTIDLWVDPKINMPTRVAVLDGNGNNLKQTDLSNVIPNGPIEDGDLQMEKIDLDKGWNAHDR